MYLSLSLSIYIYRERDTYRASFQAPGSGLGICTVPLRAVEFSCPLNFTGCLPESLTQGLLIGKLLIGGLGV